MQIDKDALYSLQIFSDETHPSKHLGTNQEGLSLYSILNRCKTAGGKKRLREWFMRPLIKQEKINDRQDTVQWLIDHKNLIPELQSHLRGINNIKIFFRGGIKLPSGTDYRNLLSFVNKVGEIRQLLELSAEDLLPQIGKTVAHVVDFEESEAQNRVCVTRGIENRLDELRIRYESLPQYLDETVQEVSQEIELPENSRINVLYFPQLGYLVAIAKDHTLPLIPNFELQFETENVAYFKNERMRQLDEILGDVHTDMIDIEVEILTSLFNSICEFGAELESHSTFISDLDCLLSFAICSIEMDLVRPLFSESRLCIEKGRHLLLEQETVVPNDFSVENRTIIVSGPNSSGKSVFMKQLGLIVFMAQIGCFVPAVHCSLPIFDKILTRIKTSETLSKGESAFMTDLRQVERIVHLSTSRSLVLIDEFGKGTNPIDGIALFCGVIEYLSKKEEPPISIAVTHFNEIFKKNLIQTPVEFLSMEFVENDDNPVYLFKVVKGPSLKSFASYCGKRAGIDESILRDAKVFEEMIEAYGQNVELRYAHHPDENQERLLISQYLQ